MAAVLPAALVVENFMYVAGCMMGYLIVFLSEEQSTTWTPLCGEAHCEHRGVESEIVTQTAAALISFD